MGPAISSAILPRSSKETLPLDFMASTDSSPLLGYDGVLFNPKESVTYGQLNCRAGYLPPTEIEERKRLSGMLEICYPSKLFVVLSIIQ